MRKSQNIAITSNITKASNCYAFLLDQIDEQLGLLYGDPGVGKTTAIMYLAGQFDATYISAMPGWSHSAMANAIAQKLGLPRSRGYIDAMDKLIERLSTRQTALFLDEADFIVASSALLDTVRVLHDQAEIPILLIGMTGIYPKLAAHKLFIDRVQYFLELPNGSQEDTSLMAKTRCSIKVKPDLLDHIQAQTKGNARQVKRVLAHVESFGRVNGWEEMGMSEWGNRSLLPANTQAPTKARRAA